MKGKHTMEEYEVISIPVSDGTERDFAIMDTFEFEGQGYPSFQRTQFMMVNNLHDFSFIDIVNCLIFLIMVHKCYFFPVHIQKISSGNCSDTFSLFVNYRERTLPSVQQTSVLRW